jgi:hypothetical protein
MRIHAGWNFRKGHVVIKLASWGDESHTSLAPYPPESTDVIVVLEAA